MAGKTRKSESDPEDPSLLVPETPAETSNPFRSTEDRLRSLESAMEVFMAQQNIFMAQMLQTTPRSHTPNSEPPANPPRRSPTPPPPTTHSQPKAATPDAFDGDRTKGRNFLTTCQLYLSLRQSEFSNDQQRIHWMLSYMKSGRAATFAQSLLRNETKTGRSEYSNFAEFADAFEAEFCPEDEKTHSLMRLESDKFYQGARSVSEYIDEFRNLVALSGLTDPVAIVLKFRRGLNPTVQNKIGESENRPDNTDIAGWYTTARRIDLNRLTNEAFNSGHLPRYSVPTRTPIQRNYLQRNMSYHPNPTPPPTRHHAPPPTPSTTLTPRPAISAPDGRHSAPKCYLCRRPGHLARDCDLSTQIRSMSLSDRQDWLQGVMASVDEADAQDKSEEHAELSEQPEDGQTLVGEDFVSHSG
jgi:hypothetical protein